jgi:hypothetical protein
MHHDPFELRSGRMDAASFVCQEVAAGRNVSDVNRAKTCCPLGHPYSGENLKITRRGWRQCRTCFRRQKYESKKRCKKRRPSNKIPNGAKTHCPAGHPYSGENLIYCVSAKSRRCKECIQRRDRERSLSSSTMFLVMEALHSGQSLSQICGAAKGSTPIVYGFKLHYFRKAHPPLDRRISVLAAKNERLRRERMRMVFRPASTNSSDEEMFAELSRLIPRHLTADMQDDVLGNMVLDWREGRYSFDEIKARVRKFVSSEYQKNHNNWGMLSLDKPVSEDSDFTIGDTVTRGMWNDDTEME